MNYYEVLADESIGRSTPFKEVAEKAGLTLTTNEEIVFASDGKRYLASEVPPEPIVNLKACKLKEINEWTLSAITGGFISTCTGLEMRYDSDTDTQLTMLALNANVGADVLAKRYPNGYPIRGYKKLLDSFETEKTLQYLNPEQVVQFCADLSEHLETQKRHGWELQERVKLATTSSELYRIVW